MDVSGLLTTEEPIVQAWVPFDEDTEVLLQYASPDELRKMRKQATKTTFVRHQKDSEYDEMEANRLLGRKCVKDWRPRKGKKGFTKDGQTVPYSPETCDLFMTRWVSFSSFVNVTVTEFEQFVREEKEREIQD